MPSYLVVLISGGKSKYGNKLSSSVAKRLRELQSSHGDEFAILRKILNTIQQENTGVKAYDEYVSNEVIKKLPKACGKDTLWEIRAPKTRRSGVIRAYFHKARNSERKLVLLDAEFKVKKEPNLSTACKRLKEYIRDYDN